MIVCDRCKKPARHFCFGDFVNEDYEFADFCYDCSVKLRSLILRYKHNEDLVVINRPVSDFPED